MKTRQLCLADSNTDISLEDRSLSLSKGASISSVRSHTVAPIYKRALKGCEKKLARSLKNTL